MSEALEDSVHGEYAGFASRMAGFLIDLGILTVVNVVGAWALLELLNAVGIDPGNCESLAARSRYLVEVCEWLPFLGTLAGTSFILVYGLFFWATTGQTPGKAAMGVRVVRLDGRPMNLISAVRRVAGFALSLWTFGLGFLVILSDDRRQGWHDKIARTCVVYSWGDVPEPAQPGPRTSVYQRR
jgi:uncharacterized RDD family membrane protein YckC